MSRRQANAEEFYSRCVVNAHVLDAAARQHARSGEPVKAFAAAWGTDVNILQAAVWERILVASRSPQRHYFQAAEAVVRALDDDLAHAETDPSRDRSPVEVLRAARSTMEAAFDSALAADMQSRWPDLSYLSALDEITAEAMEIERDTRLEGLALPQFVAQRRREADALLLEAQGCRIRNDVTGAIGAAYAGDFKSFEAYLVESAVATGDRNLLTVSIRWDLAVHAVGELTSLPDDFPAAVGLVRSTLADSLGETDGARLLKAFARG